jgi:hypothetical protein
MNTHYDHSLSLELLAEQTIKELFSKEEQQVLYDNFRKLYDSMHKMMLTELTLEQYTRVLFNCTPQGIEVKEARVRIFDALINAKRKSELRKEKRKAKKDKS